MSSKAQPPSPEEITRRLRKIDFLKSVGSNPDRKIEDIGHELGISRTVAIDRWREIRLKKRAIKQLNLAVCITTIDIIMIKAVNQIELNKSENGINQCHAINTQKSLLMV